MNDLNTLDKNLPLNNDKKIIYLVAGEASGDIEAALGNLTATRIVATMEDAVAFAHTTASPGEVVLLSPGCASFDMYQDYKERGDVFRKTVCERKT